MSEADRAADDVLAGWDPAGPPPVLDGRAPFPTDTVVAVGAIVAGMVAGLALGGRHPLVRAQVAGCSDSPVRSSHAGCGACWVDRSDRSGPDGR